MDHSARFVAGLTVVPMRAAGFMRPVVVDDTGAVGLWLSRGWIGRILDSPPVCAKWGKQYAKFRKTYQSWNERVAKDGKAGWG